MTDINYPTASNAVISLVPNHSGFNIEDEKIIAWNTADEKTGVVQPTQAEIDAELVKLRAEFDALAYARSRQAEYPDYARQFDILYHSGVAGLKAELKKTKDKFPKG